MVFLNKKNVIFIMGNWNVFFFFFFGSGRIFSIDFISQVGYSIDTSELTKAISLSNLSFIRRPAFGFFQNFK